MKNSALIFINFIVPGLGTLIMGKIVQGFIQLAITFCAWLLIWTTLGRVLGIIFLGISMFWVFINAIAWTDPYAIKDKRDGP